MAIAPDCDRRRRSDVGLGVASCGWYTLLRMPRLWRMVSSQTRKVSGPGLALQPSAPRTPCRRKLPGKFDALGNPAGKNLPSSLYVTSRLHGSPSAPPLQFAAPPSPSTQYSHVNGRLTEPGQSHTHPHSPTLIHTHPHSSYPHTHHPHS